MVAHFVKKYAAEMGRPAPEVSKEAMQSIYDHAWPGNVRELENALERAVILAGSAITPQDLPLEGVGEDLGSELTLPRGLTITQAVEELELRMIKRALAENNGVAAHAARALGVTKSNLAYKMKKYGL